ncbi:MAG: EpsG family protein [Nitrososphaeria archaeon]
MLMYIVIYVLILNIWLLAYNYKPSKELNIFIKVIVFTLLLIFIGLRHEVGGDWTSYLFWYRMVESGKLRISFESFITRDIGYDITNLISSKLNFGIYGVNTLCGAIFLFGLFYFLSRALPEKEFWTGLILAYPYLIVVVANGYTRQSVAIGLIMIAYIKFLHGKQLASLFYILGAFVFHKTAVFAITPMLFCKPSKRFLRLVLVIFLVNLIAIRNVVLTKFSTFYSFYIHEKMVSEGGPIRAIMNLLPALIYLTFFKQLRRKFSDSGFWVVVSVLTVILSVSSLSKLTAADRLLLYLSSIQLVTYPRLIYVKLLPSNDRPVKSMLVILVLTIYTLSLIVWLFLGKHAGSWIPYKNLLFSMTSIIYTH